MLVIAQAVTDINFVSPFSTKVQKIRQRHATSKTKCAEFFAVINPKIACFNYFFAFRRKDISMIVDRKEAFATNFQHVRFMHVYDLQRLKSL